MKPREARRRERVVGIQERDDARIGERHAPIEGTIGTRIRLLQERHGERGSGRERFHDARTAIGGAIVNDDQQVGDVRLRSERRKCALEIARVVVERHHHCDIEGSGRRLPPEFRLADRAARHAGAKLALDRRKRRPGRQRLGFDTAGRAQCFEVAAAVHGIGLEMIALGPLVPGIHEEQGVLHQRAAGASAARALATHTPIRRRASTP